jgi:hypothetical protein
MDASLALSSAKKSSICFAESFGQRDDQLPFYHAKVVLKPGNFVAQRVAVMQLVESDQLDLNAPLNQQPNRLLSFTTGC